jgi:hypothetical protein
MDQLLLQQHPLGVSLGVFVCKCKHGMRFDQFIIVHFIILCFNPFFLRYKTFSSPRYTDTCTHTHQFTLKCHVKLLKKVENNERFVDEFVPIKFHISKQTKIFFL